MNWKKTTGVFACALLVFLLNTCTVDIWPSDPAGTGKPTTPTKPIGSTLVLGLESYYYPYQTCASDPDNDKLTYQFKVNSTIIPSKDSWSSYFSSGDTVVYLAHFVDNAVTAYVSARVKDMQGNISDWSKELLVSVTSIWKRQWSGSVTLNSVSCANASTCWSVGTIGTILKTSDGGNTWTKQTSGTSRTLTCVFFTDASNGWVAGDSGTVLRTTDGGSNWYKQSSGTSAHLNLVQFVDANTGWIVGYGGTIIKTTNGGDNWVRQATGMYEDVLCACFVNANTGWAVGYDQILKTVDGGKNWYTQLYLSWETSVRSIYFINAYVGWAVGSYGTILKTSDGGSTWYLVSTASSHDLECVFFTDANNGWIVGHEGPILKTSDGGNSWYRQSVSGDLYLSSVRFADTNIGWAVGYGVILKTTLGGMSTRSQEFTASSSDSVSCIDSKKVLQVSGPKGTAKTKIK